MERLGAANHRPLPSHLSAGSRILTLEQVAEDKVVDRASALMLSQNATMPALNGGTGPLKKKLDRGSCLHAIV